MILTREVSGGVVFLVRVQPGARRDAVLGEHAGALKVSVCAAPDRGKANKAVLALLAEGLGVAKSALALVSGETSREKRVFVEGVGVAQVRDVLKGRS
ncbi:MAG: DUF167 domain-containing protein [Planctomycetes bacterium]|nr:DUF167 domain-containing protein [Planctomycetota bacterium]